MAGPSPSAAVRPDDDDDDLVDRRRHVSFAVAADYLGVSIKTLERKYIDGGLIPWYDFAGTKRIRRQDLLEFAKKSRLVGPRPASHIPRKPE